VRRACKLLDPLPIVGLFERRLALRRVSTSRFAARVPCGARDAPISALQGLSRVLGAVGSAPRAGLRGGEVMPG